MDGQSEGCPFPPDFSSHPDAVILKDTTGSTTQAIDLSTSMYNPNLGVPGEKTPDSYGEVPDFVLARLSGENSVTESSASCSSSSSSKSSQKHPISRQAARVCLEQRFNAMSADTQREQDTPSAVLTNFQIMFQQSAEAQEVVVYPQMKWMHKISFQATCPYVIGHYPHMVEQNKHPASILQNSFSPGFLPNQVVAKTHCTSSSNSTGDLATADSRKQGSIHCPKPNKASVAAAGAESRSSIRGTACSRLPNSQRNQRGICRERERRKIIRQCCDELNTLVPFCYANTDKATTLRWTTTYLKYINKTNRDTLKEEFQREFIDKTRFSVNGRPSPSQYPFDEEMDQTVSTALGIEQ